VLVPAPSIVLRAGALALRLHHHFRGPEADYLGLLAAAFASWAGIPGPGEAALITTGVLAAKHHLDIVSTIAVAWAGATAGGTFGWLVGLWGGRALLGGPGPLRRARAMALARGDRFFERYGLIAIFVAPSWVAGVHRMRWTRYLPANALASLTWAVGVGLSAYAVGPSVTDVVSDIGLAGSVALGAVIAVAVAGAWLRRTRRAV
jgi:membrane protein DedA with SNARE-associated domain